LGYDETNKIEREAVVGFFKRLFGICETKPPQDENCWSNQINHVVVDLKKAPELNQPGGAFRLEGKGLPERVLVMRGNDGQAYAFINKCAHAGRRLDPQPGTPTVQCCSLGKSTYNYQGEVLSGSAKKPISTLKVREEPGDKLIILLVPGGVEKGTSQSLVGTSALKG
jgi:nitrite reductase/ring-hydroxylating ferredoxin subunit